MDPRDIKAIVAQEIEERAEMVGAINKAPAVKSFLESKTIIGVFISLLPTIGALFGVEITVGDVERGAEGVDHILQGIGALLAIYGRVTAKTQVSIRG